MWRVISLCRRGILRDPQFSAQSDSDWRLELDVAVTLGFAFQAVASKLCFRDKSQLKLRFWWMAVCSERVGIIPSFRGRCRES